MRVLGVVEWVNKDRDGHPIAGVIPLYDVTQAEEWRAVRSTEFPIQGQVFWFQAHAAQGVLLFFSAEDNSRGERFKFRVAEPQVALEVLDLRPHGSPEEVRQGFADGLPLPGFVPDRTLLWCGGEVCIGPVKLTAVASGRYTFEYFQPYRIPCHSEKTLAIRQVSDSRARRWVLAVPSLGTPSAYVDWDNDRDVAHRAITWAVNAAKEHGVDPGLTRRLIDEAANRLTEAGASPDLRLAQYRLERVRQIAAERQRAEALAHSAVEALQASPPIARELVQLREETKRHVTAEVREAMQAEMEARASAQRELETIQTAIDAAHAQLQDLHARIEAEVREVDAEISRRLEVILKKPATLLADVAILQAVLRGLSAMPAPVRHAHTPGERPAVMWVQGRVITQQLEFRRGLVNSCKAVGVSPRIASRIHAAVSAGLLPVLAGPGAGAALDAYARVACGGRIFRAHVTPSFLEPTDLLGKVDFARARFLPHAAGLIDVLETAHGAKGLALVMLEGINRAPTESYLLPVLQCALGKTSLRLFHPAVVAEEDPYRDMAELQWPSNVWIAATLIDGPTTLPVSRDLWSSAVLIETDDDVSSSLPLPLPEATELDPEGDLVKLSEPQSDLAESLLETLPEFHALRETSERFLGALSPFERDRSTLEATWVESLLLPLIASLDDAEDRDETLRRVAQARGVTPPELSALVRRVRRRVA